MRFLCVMILHIFSLHLVILHQRKKKIYHLTDSCKILLPYFTLQVMENKVYTSQKNVVSLFVKYLFLEPQTLLQFSFSNENSDFVTDKIVLRTPKH